jgi:hypothetical protein
MDKSASRRHQVSMEYIYFLSASFNQGEKAVSFTDSVDGGELLRGNGAVKFLKWYGLAHSVNRSH